MKLFLQAEPAELFAQHSTEKVVAASFTSKVLLDIHDPKDLLSGKKLWIPSVISSVQLKKRGNQLIFGSQWHFPREKVGRGKTYLTSVLEGREG